MAELKLSKRYKFAGDIMQELLDIGFDLETATDFLNSIPDADVVPRAEIAVTSVQQAAKIYALTEEVRILEFVIKDSSLAVMLEGAKAEIERLQEDVDRLQEINNRHVENVKLAKAEAAREIFKEVENIIRKHNERPEYRLMIDLAELKMKYTEGSDVAYGGPREGGKRFAEKQFLLYRLKREVHDKAVRPHNAGIDAYISLKVFDAILQGYLNKLE